MMAQSDARREKMGVIKNLQSLRQLVLNYSTVEYLSMIGRKACVIFVTTREAARERQVNINHSKVVVTVSIATAHTQRQDVA